MSREYAAKFRQFDFGGGINQRDSTYKSEIRDLDDAHNVTFEQDGSVRVRRGRTIWSDGAFQLISAPITKMHRHYGTAGDKRILVYSQGNEGKLDRKSVV